MPEIERSASNRQAAVIQHLDTPGTIFLIPKALKPAGPTNPSKTKKYLYLDPASIIVETQEAHSNDANHYFSAARPRCSSASSSWLPAFDCRQMDQSPVENSIDLIFLAVPLKRQAPLKPKPALYTWIPRLSSCIHVSLSKKGQQPGLLNGGFAD
jgi:hypothetical protein